MIKKIVTGALISVAMVGLSGCGGADPKPIITQLKPMKPVVITLSEKDPVSTEKLQISNLNIISQIQGFSRFKEYRRYKCPSYCKYAGLLIEKHNNQLIFDYTRETTYGNSERRIMKQNHTVFNMPYSIDKNTLTFNFPTTSKKELISSLGLTGNPIGSDSAIQNDIKQIYSKLSTLHFSKSFKLQGEINSKYSAQSIYANFKRMVGNYSYKNTEKITESKKQNTFNLNVNGKNLPLYVEVFPYREGSKVKYSTVLPYQITHNGSSLTKQDIENIKTQIAKIVND